jgi:hypothetical protein
LEGKYGPWTWATDVVYCNAVEDGSLDCKKATPSQPGANGAVLADDGKLLAVNDVLEGSTSLYKVDQETKALTLSQKIVSWSCLSDASGELLTEYFRC